MTAQGERIRPRAVTEGEPVGFLMLVATSRGKLLGAQIVGPAAGEYIDELALALHQHLSLSDLAAATHVYPTIALGIQPAAGKYSLEGTANSGLVKLLRRFGGLRAVRSTDAVCYSWYRRVVLPFAERYGGVRRTFA